MNTEARMMVANAVVKQKEKHLEHYGILGMKWGIRRYQPYGMGGYNPKDTGKYVGKRKLQRELNKTDKQRAKFQDSVTIARNKQAKYQIGGDDTAASKWKKTGDDYEARLNEAKARTKELLRQADEQGFDVHSKEVQRHVRSGQHFLEWFAAGIPGLVAGNIAENAINGKSGAEAGTKYKLSKRKEDQRVNQMADALAKGDKDTYNKVRNSFDSDEAKDVAERKAGEINNRTSSTITPQQAKAKVEKAKSTDMWNIEFLETIQNDERYGNKNWMAKEYEKFLTDKDYRKKYYQYAKQA